MRVLGLLNAVIFGLALIPLAAKASNLRSMKEVHAELVALEARGVQDKTFKGLSLVDPEEIFTNSKIFYPLLSTLQSFVKNAKYGSGFHSADDNRLIKSSEIRARMFRVWVELLRYGVRSEDELIRRLTLGRLSPIAVIDYDLIDDVVELAFSHKEDEALLRTLKDALHCFEGCMNYSLNDLGIVEEDLKGKQGPSAGNYINMKLLAPWRAKAPREKRSERMKRSADLLSYSHGRVSIEGWKIISDFVKNEWSDSPLEIKKAIVEVVEGLTLCEHDSMDLMLELDKAKRIVPLRIALIKTIRHRAFGYEKAAKWVRSMAEDPSPAVRAETAFAIGQYGTSNDLSILNKMFARDLDPNVRIRAAFALGSYWEKKGTTDTREMAFAKLAQVFMSSTGSFRNALGRALSMWHGVPATTMAAYGLTGKVIDECERAVFNDSDSAGTAAAMEKEDFWAEEASAK